MKPSEFQEIAERAEIHKKLCQSMQHDWRNSELGIDEFRDKYGGELKRRLIITGDYTDDDAIETMTDTVFTEVQWNRYKKIYEFDPWFVNYLATTEAGELHKSVLERLPFKSFYISFGDRLTDGIDILQEYSESREFTACVGVFVYIYFNKDEFGGEFVNLALSLRGDNDRSCVPIFIGVRDGCNFEEATNIDNFPEEVRKWVTHNYDPKQIEAIHKKQEFQKPYITLALNACQYLCASNAEIKDLKVTKKDKPMVKLPNGKKKPVSLNVSQVGFRLGQQFEKMYQNLESETRRTGVKGIRRKPHVRRAHWHHYWTGPGRTVLEVRWLEPVFVMGTEEEIDAVVHEVKGETA